MLVLLTAIDCNVENNSTSTCISEKINPSKALGGVGRGVKQTKATCVPCTVP